MEFLSSSLETAGFLLAAMAIVAAVEAGIPLRARGRAGRAHLVPNLVLTLATFAGNAALGAALVALLLRLEQRGVGLLAGAPLGAGAHLLVVLLALDLAFYVSHVAMHKIPLFWRFHRLHHADPAVDVTTSFRQHPGEGLIRYAFLAVAAGAVGASPAAFVTYRAAVALSALAEHANVRAPAWLDRVLSLVFTWPHVHKVHHARDLRFTDTNYGNLVCWWDRLFGTFTPSGVGATVRYGLDGFDDPRDQTTARLLALPFAHAPRPDGPEAARAASGATSA